MAWKNLLSGRALTLSCTYRAQGEEWRLLRARVDEGVYGLPVSARADPPAGLLPRCGRQGDGGAGGGPRGERGSVEERRGGRRGGSHAGRLAAAQVSQVSGQPLPNGGLGWPLRRIRSWSISWRTTISCVGPVRRDVDLVPGLPVAPRIGRWNRRSSHPARSSTRRGRSCRSVRNRPRSSPTTPDRQPAAPTADFPRDRTRRRRAGRRGPGAGAGRG